MLMKMINVNVLADYVKAQQALLAEVAREAVEQSKLAGSSTTTPSARAGQCIPARARVVDLLLSSGHANASLRTRRARRKPEVAKATVRKDLTLVASYRTRTA